MTGVFVVVGAHRLCKRILVTKKMGNRETNKPKRGNDKKIRELGIESKGPLSRANLGEITQ